MYKLIAGFALFTLAASVVITYASGLLGQQDWFVTFLALAVALLSASLAWSARTDVTGKAFTIGGVAVGTALVIFGFGATSSLVVDGRVVSHNSETAKVYRQVTEIRNDSELLEKAVVLLQATPAEQFARAGEAAKLSDSCSEMLKKWDRTAPVVGAIIPSIVAMKDGSSSCVQGTTVSSQSSATPDAQTTQAIAAARTTVEDSLVTIAMNTEEVLRTQNLTESSDG